jgi:hypothetical protein
VRAAAPSAIRQPGHSVPLAAASGFGPYRASFAILVAVTADSVAVTPGGALGDKNRHWPVTAADRKARSLRALERRGTLAA